MPFTATIKSIDLVNDQFQVCVEFADSATSFSSNKNYFFKLDTTASQASQAITADGELLKANLTRLNQVRGNVGAVIII